MSSRLFRASLRCVFACVLGPGLAHADVYTWIDSSGNVTVSNLAPPGGVRVTNVVRQDADAAARIEAARNAAREAELAALSERVRQLERQADVAARPAPPEVEYPALSPPAAVQFAYAPPPAMQYDGEAPPQAVAACDPSWMNCGLGWGPFGYPASVVVLRAPRFHRPHVNHGGHHGNMRPPRHSPVRLRRG